MRTAALSCEVPDLAYKDAKPVARMNAELHAMAAAHVSPVLLHAKEEARDRAVAKLHVRHDAQRSPGARNPATREERGGRQEKECATPARECRR